MKLLKIHEQLWKPVLTLQQRRARRENQIEKMKKNYLIALHHIFHPVPTRGKGIFLGFNRGGQFGGALSGGIPAGYDFDPWGKWKAFLRKRLSGAA